MTDKINAMRIGNLMDNAGRTYTQKVTIDDLHKFKLEVDASDEDDFFEKACIYLESTFNFLVDLAELIETI